MLRHSIMIRCGIGRTIITRRNAGMFARTKSIFASEGQQPQQQQQQQQQQQVAEKTEVSSTEEAPPSKGRSLFAKLKQYGPAGLLIYLTIHSIGFWITFCAVYCGLPVKQFLSEFLGESYQLPEGPWAEFAIALAVNKLFVPVQVLLTVAITPTVRPILLAWGPTQWLIAFVAKWKTS
eukprot:TRINITY_DN302_c1_g1_i2.p1 TRINITY_DN302_c1_g1~~TRINITY_DN302_c1_g1_i2.p1  ORF type:complete len:178 (+),score=22.77 TRINITY_DN302_c1_g1_i2:41-574(+)